MTVDTQIALRKTGRVLVAVLLAVLAVLQVFPLVWVFNYSLQKSGDLFGPEFFKLPVDPQWSNYVRAWVDGEIPVYLMNSIIVTVIAVALSTVFSFCIAYACTRMTWKLRSFVYGIVMLGMVVPIHTTLLPNFIWFSKFGLINSRWGLIIPYIAFTMSFNVLVFSGILKNLPRSMEESAFMDGANYFTILGRIIAPMAVSGFVTVGVMTFLNDWNEYIMANTYLSSDSLRTLPFSVIRFQGQYASDYAVQFACMTLVALPPLVLYLFFNKKIMAGVTAGAIKG